MSTKAIEHFLEFAYSDERLAALLAHAEDGKLALLSCCCLIGIPSADHALRGQGMRGEPHYLKAKYQLADEHGQVAAEVEFEELGFDDVERRAKLIPLIKAEMVRRDSLRTQDACSTKELVRESELAGVSL